MNLTSVFPRFLMVISALLLSGCALISGPWPQSSPEAMSALSALESRNHGLTTFNGIGSVRIINDDLSERFRLAWAGQRPDRFRGTALVSGTPIETFATDGKYFYLKSHTDAHWFIKKRARNSSLERIISVPITPEDIVSILSGSIPLRDYTHLTLASDTTSTGKVLTLHYRHSPTQRITMTADGTPVRVDYLKSGSRVFTLTLSDFTTVDTFSFPTQITISTDDSKCLISVSRHGANPHIAPETFTLSSS